MSQPGSRRRCSYGDVVMIGLVLLFLLMLLLAAAGGMAALTGRYVARAEVDEEPVLVGRLAVRIDDGLDRTAYAVESLVSSRPIDDTDDLLADRAADPARRRTTYLVMGAGLLGLAATMALGLVMVTNG